MSKLTKSLLGVGLAVALLAGLELSGTTKVTSTLFPSSTDKAIDRVSDQIEVYQMMVAGCAAKASTIPQLAMMVAMSQGGVCVQIIERDVKDVLDGKTGYTSGDKKAAFAAGYVKTYLATGGQINTQEMRDAIKSEIDEQYSKLASVVEESEE